MNIDILNLVNKNKNKINIIKQAGNESRVVSILENGGLLSQKRKGYQERRAQIIMARTIEECIARGESAVIEAATGTGKSLGYLLPAVLSNRITVISTANKALQAQLFGEDIPFVQMNIKQFEAALLKGMNNFLCLDKLEKYRQEWHELDDSKLSELVAAVTARGGDFEKLDYQSELQPKINGESEECPGRKKCSHGEACFYYKMRDKVKDATVIVTNHTMLLLDAELGGKILPPFDVLVIDEAHKLEEEAQKCFSTKITQGRFKSLLNRKLVKRVVEAKDLEEIKKQVGKLFDDVRFPKEKTIITETIQSGIILSGLLHNLSTVLKNQEGIDYTKLSERALRLALDTSVVCTVKPSEDVHFVERKKDDSLEIARYPLNVSTLLYDNLFSAHKRVIATSATLSTNNNKNVETFDFFVKRTGMQPQVQKVLPSVFDYQSNALFYIPRDIAQPMRDNEKSQRYYDWMISTRMQKLVELSRGRAFLLFTSNRAMEAVYKQLDVPYPILKQGDLPKPEMVKRFKQEPSVLLGVASFWEGVDVAGDMLSLVVIDKLPNDPPDPIHDGIKNLMSMQEGNKYAGWNNYSLPRAIIKLKQGVGRLIRSDTDTGVMAILDQRLHTQGYGKQILASLPPAVRTSNIDDVASFFERN